MTKKNLFRFSACLMAIVFAVALGFAFSICYAGIQQARSGLKWTELLLYQKTKLRAADGNTIFLVGDSSLGNCMDTKKLNKPAVNLALNGVFGSGGSYAFAREIFRKGGHTLIVMQTADIFTRPLEDSRRGYVYAAMHWQDLRHASPKALAGAYLTSDMFNTTRAQWKKGRNLLSWESDYIPQSDDRFALKTVPQWHKDNLRHVETFKKLGDLCREHGARCYFLNGPIYKDYYDRNHYYLAAMQQTMAELGFIVPQHTPYILNSSNVGDENDHVHPSKKVDCTQHYSRLVPELN